MEIDRFIKIIAVIAVSMGVIFFIVNILYGATISYNIAYCIGILTSNIPEGLQITVTVSMALAAAKMAARSVLVKNLQSVETLGSTSCICSDKTGTLTQNKMTVSHLFYGGNLVDANTNYEVYREAKKVGNENVRIEYDLKDPDFQEIAKAMALSSKASFAFNPSDDDIINVYAKNNRLRHHGANEAPIDAVPMEARDKIRKQLQDIENNLPIQEKHVSGDASETGVIKFVQPIYDLEDTRSKYKIYTYIEPQTNSPIDCVIPFSSELKFTLFIRDMADGRQGPSQKGDLVILMKGAPERILSRCSKILVKGEELPYDKAQQDRVKRANDSLGRMGERVLAVARYSLEPEFFPRGYEFDIKGWKSWKDVRERDPSIKGWFPMFGLTLIGLISLNDPPRPKVDHSVLTCKDAGIKVIMVTGDQPPTAAAIAHKVNIISDPTREFNYLKE